MESRRDSRQGPFGWLVENQDQNAGDLQEEHHDLRNQDTLDSLVMLVEKTYMSKAVQKLEDPGENGRTENDHDSGPSRKHLPSRHKKNGNKAKVPTFKEMYEKRQKQSRSVLRAKLEVFGDNTKSKEDERLKASQPGYDIGSDFQTVGSSSSIIGQGANMVVQVRRRQGNGRVYACKIIESKGCERSIVNELNAVRISNSSHANRHIVNILNYFPNGQWFCIIMGKADTDLHSCLDDLQRRTSLVGWKDREFEVRKNVFSWIRCLTSAMSWFHESGIRHRDIKPGNLLLYQSNIVFTDFGLAFATGRGTGKGFTDSGGDWRYAPPEAFGPTTTTDFESLETGQAGDVFSLGCVLFELLQALSVPFAKQKFPGLLQDPSLGELYAPSVQDSDFIQQARAVEESWGELNLVVKDTGYLFLMEELLNIVLDRMMTTRAGCEASGASIGQPREVASSVAFRIEKATKRQGLRLNCGCVGTRARNTSQVF